ncbi:DUF4147 domain-containing protein [Pseudomonas sp. IT-P258]|nr:hypothetical protein ASD91_18260 [Pseudomonas sp. Root68]KRB64342.1 hypothetical protein ASD95_15530 [Pseudomonas sp. Root71]
MVANYIRSVHALFGTTHKIPLYPVAVLAVGVSKSANLLAALLHTLFQSRASSYHLISDKKVSQLHADVLYEQLSTQVLANLWGGGSCTA